MSDTGKIIATLILCIGAYQLSELLKSEKTEAENDELKTENTEAD